MRTEVVMREDRGEGWSIEGGDVTTLRGSIM